MSQLVYEINFKTKSGMPGRMMLTGEFNEDCLGQIQVLTKWLEGFCSGVEAAPVPEKPSNTIQTKTQQQTSNSKPNSNSQSNEKICPIHNVPMTRHEKDGEVWYSHKIQGTDKWCKGTKS